MTLKQQIDLDLISALKSKDEIKSSSLRMLKSAIKNKEIALGKELPDNEIQEIISKEIKQRKDAKEQFLAGNRPELAQKEQAEAEILKSYLGQQLSESEITIIVQNTINKIGATTSQDMGKIMAILMPQVKGKADGSLVSKIVRDKLS